MSGAPTAGASPDVKAASPVEQTPAEAATGSSVFTAEVLTAMNRIAGLSVSLMSLRDPAAIRAAIVDAVKKLLSVESVEVFFSPLETSEGAILRIFEWGTGAEYRVRPVMSNESELTVAGRGASGVLAVIRVREKLDWTPITATDGAVLEAIATQVGLRLENLRLESELERHQASSVCALAAAIEVKDRYTAGHTKRVGLYADAIVDHLPIIDTEKEKIRLAGVLHDIGKIGVPDRILLKPDSLTRAEWDEMRLHTEAGFDIVSRVAGLEEIAEILRHHHERWDGSGYPRGLKGDEIPFASRVIAVADTFDAIVTTRPYRAAMHPSEAREIITQHAGVHFDPVVVAAFEAAFIRLQETALSTDEL